MFASPSGTWRELEQLRMLRAREARRTYSWSAGFRAAAWLTRRGVDSRTVFMAGLLFRGLASTEAAVKRAWSRWTITARGIEAAADMIPPGPGYALLLLGLLAFCALSAVIGGAQ